MLSLSFSVPVKNEIRYSFFRLRNHCVHWSGFSLKKLLALKKHNNILLKKQMRSCYSENGFPEAITFCSGYYHGNISCSLSIWKSPAPGNRQ